MKICVAMVSHSLDCISVPSQTVQLTVCPLLPRSSCVSQSKHSLEMLKICGRGSELFIHQYIHEFRVCMIRVSYSILLNWHAQPHMLLDSKSARFRNRIIASELT